VWKIMQVNDWGRETVPRASAGRAGDNRSFLRSFIFRQILSSSKGRASFGVARAWWQPWRSPILLDRQPAGELVGA